MPEVTPRGDAYSSKKALHTVVKRLFENKISACSARDDQALAGDDHPAAVLATDRIDPAHAGNGVAGIDLIEAVAALDQCAAIGDVAGGKSRERKDVGRRKAPRAFFWIGSLGSGDQSQAIPAPVDIDQRISELGSGYARGRAGPLRSKLALRSFELDASTSPIV
ncbi:hypothetical protein [Bradyrhizobium sp. SEMIA]|uniref:hypothetical protein n=1 Tax=Bradyrhizobium sp. SEMIA TaxID=2597515 RepID=UPI0018A4ED89|nr:hypothetical protein [Bradyrhizobium sp. SEMIA]QOG18148.1 hypothetical protein FOM02_13070 [Bradyrhizobium sp. SEMIA]